MSPPINTSVMGNPSGNEATPNTAVAMSAIATKFPADPACEEALCAEDCEVELADSEEVLVVWIEV